MDNVESDGEKVLILGAGATRDAAMFEGQPVFLPPLDVDFFAIAERIVAEGSVPYDQLVSGLNDIGYASTADLAQHRLEDAFTQLAMIAFGDREGPDLDPFDFDINQAYAGLMSLITHVIARTTEGVSPDRGAPLYELIQQCTKDGSHLTIISLNYDLVVERTLRSLAQASVLEWDVVKSYSMGFPDIARGDHKDAFWEQTVRLIKPHGSLNWALPARLQSARKDHSYLGGFVGPALFPFLNIPVDDEGWLDMVTYTKSITSFNPDHEGFLWPFFVPPMTTKSRIGNFPLMREWEFARSALGRTQEVLVYGYSFPPTDEEAWQSLRELRDDARVTVIDPSAALVDRIEKELPTLRVTHQAPSSLRV